MKNLSRSQEENKSAHSEVLGYLGFPMAFLYRGEAGQVKAGL